MNLYWIKTEDVHLAIVPRPRGWDWLPDDISSLWRSGLHVVVSALTEPEIAELGLESEAKCCQENSMEFLSFPIEDRSVPSSVNEFKDFVGRLKEYLEQGKAVGVHCRAGIGRSSTIVAFVLIAGGLSAESAFHEIENTRGCSVPDTPEQRQWVERHLLKY